MYCYKIGGVGYRFETANELLESPNYGLFRIDEAGFDSLQCRHTFGFSDNYPEINGKEIFNGGSFRVFENADGYFKISQRFDEYEYKCIFFEKKNKSGGTVYFTDGGYEKLKTTAELFRIIDMMSSLLFFDALMLHASFIEYNGKAILFSADPGVGKSTQAELWRVHKNAKIINGDRAILRHTPDGWRAYGNPACGSSDICINADIPIETIVFLKQSPVNIVNELSAFDKFLRLSSQLSCGVRKATDTDKLLELTQKLAADVRIVELECTADERAVNALYEILGG